MINKLSEDLLLLVKMDKPSEELVNQLSITNLSTFTTQLNDDNSKKAFWINIYNAFYLILRTKRDTDKSKIYKSREIIIASEALSLDDIEHGILRKYRSKLSRGYLPKLFVSKLIKSLAVTSIDYRIHFALNCGAKSCPPISFYKSESIDQQLELATHSFVEGETKINSELKLITTTSLFSWYKADFGSSHDIKKIISKVFDTDLSEYRIKYNKYDWSEDLNNFA